MNNPHVGIMCKFKSKTEADKYINDREREAAAALKCRWMKQSRRRSAMSRTTNNRATTPRKKSR